MGNYAQLLGRTENIIQAREVADSAYEFAKKIAKGDTVERSVIVDKISAGLRLARLLRATPKPLRKAALKLAKTERAELLSKPLTTKKEKTLKKGLDALDKGAALTMGRRVYNHSRGALEVRAETLEAPTRIHGPLTAPDTLARITRGLEKLHRGLTRDRKRFIKSRYLRDREMRQAYATYMTCAQAPKLDAILDSLGPLPKLGRPLRVLELGCGTGAGVSSLGVAARQQGVELHHMATDRVPEALEVTQSLASTSGYLVSRHNRSTCLVVSRDSSATQNPMTLSSQ